MPQSRYKTPLLEDMRNTKQCFKSKFSTLSSLRKKTSGVMAIVASVSQPLVGKKITELFIRHTGTSRLTKE